MPSAGVGGTAILHHHRSRSIEDLEVCSASPGFDAVPDFHEHSDHGASLRRCRQWNGSGSGNRVRECPHCSCAAFCRWKSGGCEDIEVSILDLLEYPGDPELPPCAYRTGHGHSRKRCNVSSCNGDDQKCSSKQSLGFHHI